MTTVNSVNKAEFEISTEGKCFTGNSYNDEQLETLDELIAKLCRQGNELSLEGIEQKQDRVDNLQKYRLRPV